MEARLELNEILRKLMLEFNGWVYYQPPESIRLQYPCIIYNIDSKDIRPADNRPYMKKSCYQVMIIDEDPDSKIPEKVEELPFVRWSNHFTQDDLHHFVYKLYY